MIYSHSMAANPKLTVLTDPIPCGRYFFTEIAKNAGRPVKNFLRPIPPFMRNEKYRGHFAVTRSLVEGLRKIGATFNYNPKRLTDIGEVVIVLSGIGTLRQAIQWKKEGRIHKLFAGPNLFVMPSEECPEIANPEVDFWISPSDWPVWYVEEDMPELAGRALVWPAGVDTEYWRPSKKIRERTSVTIFIKGVLPNLDLPTGYVECLREAGFDDTDTNFIYRGNGRYYTQEEYFLKLDQSGLLIGFSLSESQGIAWAEAWSMDVPTFIWHNDETIIKGRSVRVSTAPYLNPQNGAFFKNARELRILFEIWKNGGYNFSPRKWVIDNMSDEICSQRLLEIIFR